MDLQNLQARPEQVAFYMRNYEIWNSKGLDSRVFYAGLSQTGEVKAGLYPFMTGCAAS